VDPAGRVDDALLFVSLLVDLDLTHNRGLPAKPAEALRSCRLGEARRLDAEVHLVWR
jgi:hypothetical protein